MLNGFECLSIFSEIYFLHGKTKTIHSRGDIKRDKFVHSTRLEVETSKFSIQMIPLACFTLKTYNIVSFDII